MPAMAISKSLLQSRGKKWEFGEAAWKGRRGLLPGLCSPQSTVKQGEGFLPTQPSVTFYEQQDPRTATAPNLGEQCGSPQLK
ncbi:hypothetical protein LEMLEM_LOCUS3883 [Lemmus lemmus]